MAPHQALAIEVTARDICSATGTISIPTSSDDPFKLLFPNILFIEHERFPSFERASALLRSVDGHRELIFPSFPSVDSCIPFPGKDFSEFTGGHLHADPTAIRRFARETTAFSAKQQQRGACYFAGVGSVFDYALLHYLGADLFDSVPLIQAARDGLMLFPDGAIPVRALSTFSEVCSCPACLSFVQRVSDGSNETTQQSRKFDEILLHNCHAALDELARMRTSIEQGQFRTFVERRCTARPELITLLRILDSEHFSWQEQRTPRTALSHAGSVEQSFQRNPLSSVQAGTGHRLDVVTAESLDRPDIERFRKHIVNEYRKPGSADILLLLPCSARKPYSFSKTHRMIRDAIMMPGSNRVHEVIVTSPMGLVPRELELFPPVPFYDISVTGSWSASEEHLIATMLRTFLERNNYTTIINHFDGTGKDDFVHELLKSACEKQGIHYSATRKGKAVDPGSLQQLRAALGAALTENGSESEERIGSGSRHTDDMFNRLAAQFGPAAASGFGHEFVVSGRYPRLKLFERILEEGNSDNDERDDETNSSSRYRKGEQLGMLTIQRSMLSLTLSGAERLASCGHSGAGAFTVQIEDFHPRGNIFATGVISATEDIRAGDEVAVVHNGELRACGVATMHGHEMGAAKRGMAVNVRHKRNASAERSP